MSAPKYEKTFCSQCGGEFGPGDSGYSHCEHHSPDKTVVNNWSGGGTLQTWKSGDWQILYARDAAGNTVTLSLESHDAVRLAFAVSPIPGEYQDRAREANAAVYELSYPEARAEELRQIADEICCGGGCEHCTQRRIEDGNFCGFIAADNLRKLAAALDLKAKVVAETRSNAPEDVSLVSGVSAESSRSEDRP